MADFLLELLSEEIPARMQDKARADLARLFAEEIAKAGLRAEAIETFATPRRLALIARGLPLETEAVSEERKGPRANAPEQALAGFLRSTGLTREQLVERDGVLFAVVEKPGRKTADVLAEAIPMVVRAFPWPKSMRWGAASLTTESLRWVRPLQGVIALLGDEIVPFEIEGVLSGAETVGHRFHHPGRITIGNAEDYAAKLRACHVIVDHEERKAIVRDGARTAAANAGLTLVEDEGLVSENAGLTEWPVPLLGSFDPDFLTVPPEVIQLTARVNQKYFVCKTRDGKLAPNFICTANIVASDGGAKIVEGNRKVLAARLSDARFFYETDLKVTLEEQAKKLEKIVFHEKLGTVADKVERVAKLARWLVEEGIIKPSPLQGRGLGEGQSATSPASAEQAHSPLSPEGEMEELAQMAETAARLAKADLVTGMVGEFPELQGIMGGYYARSQGHPDAVADAIRDHYKPVGQGDDVPTAPVTVAVSLADKLDTIAAFFEIKLPPTGSKDPFALRRASLAWLAILERGELRLALLHALHLAVELAAKGAQRASSDKQALESHGGITLGMPRLVVSRRREGFDNAQSEVVWEIFDFFADRLKVQQKEAGVRHDLIDAVFALGGEDDLVRLLARVKALQSFVSTEDGTNLLAGYKRAANILKKEGITDKPLPSKGGVGVGYAPRRDDSPTPDPSLRREGLKSELTYTPEPAEADLLAALDAAEPKAEQAIEAERFEDAMAALASLRAPIDAFFETVTVNDTDRAKREARLGMLARVRDAVHRVADFSRIEG